jgi:diguanylate cyclase (GGDEF)-like protein/PAS domain S-box-containing protein
MKLPSGLSFDHVPELQALWSELSEMRLVLGGLSVLVSAVDSDGLFAYWNRECERVTGYTSAEVVGNPNLLDLLFPDPMQKARMEELWRSPEKTFRDVETELRTKYGSVRTVSWSSLSSTYPVEGWDLWVVGVDRTEAKRNEQVLSLLAEVNSRLLQREPLASIHSFICHRVADVFRFALVSIGQRQPDGSVRMSGIAGPNAPGARAHEIRWDVASPAGGITGAAIRTGLVQRVEAEGDSSFGHSWRNRAAGRKIGASIALPLTARGTVLGALTVHAQRPDAFDPKTVDMLLRLTQQVSLSFDHAADLTEIQLQSLALDEVRHSVVITARDGTIEWVNPAFTAMTGYTREEAVGRTPRIQKSGAHDASFYEGLWKTILSGRTWEGETTNRRRDGSVYVEDQTITPVKDETGEIAHFVSVKRDVTERKRHEDAIVHLARHDPLTDLPNRRVVEENLARLLARAGRRLSSALLLVDLDNFKEVNDRAGHAAGDEVLRAFARLFLEAVRPGDLVGRIGGDEFVVLLEGAGAEEARTAAERIRDRAATVPLPEDYDGPPVGASVGVALVPGHGAPAEVLATADAALYEAKALGKGIVAVLEEPVTPRSGAWKRENSGRIRISDAVRGPADREPPR